MGVSRYYQNLSLFHITTLITVCEAVGIWKNKAKQKERKDFPNFLPNNSLEKVKKNWNLSSSAVIYKIRRHMLADVRRLKNGR